MSNIIFPAALTIDYSSLNIEMMQYYANMWNLNYGKMEKGHFEGSLFATHTPRMQLATEHFSKSFMCKGGFPDGCILLFYASNEAIYIFQNKSIEPHEIILIKQR